MKKLIYILIFIPSFVMAQNVYYVQDTSENSNASDVNAGTNISLPWATWQHAFETADAGDTVYFRDGVWYPNTLTYGNTALIIAPDTSYLDWNGDIYGNDGTAANPIHYFNYPGETPILDCSNLPMGIREYNVGIEIYNADFLHFKGLTVRYVYQPTTQNSGGDYSPAAGIGIVGTTNLTFENMSVHNIGGRGIAGSTLLGYLSSGPAYDTTRFINVDVYDCDDSLSNTPGNAADGYKITLQSKEVTADLDPNGVIPHYYLTGCRMWGCTDDGSDIGGVGTVEYSNCWFFANGSDIALDGNGLKMGGVFDSINSNIPLRIAKNCVMAYNVGIGLYDLQYEAYYQNNSRVYNNTITYNAVGMQSGLADRYTTKTNVYRNNLLYGMTDRDAGLRPQNFIVDKEYIESNNTFDYWAESGSLYRWQDTDTVTVTDADFIGPLDSTSVITAMTAARGSDGSLPTFTNLMLAEGSDLIDMGTQPYASDSVGFAIDSYGLAPDIGAFEYGEASPSPSSRKKAAIGSSGMMVINGRLAVIDSDTSSTPTPTPQANIIADHTTVDLYSDIPQNWIDTVKTKWFSIVGASHAGSLPVGMVDLHDIDGDYDVTAQYSGTPNGYQTTGLRSSSVAWGTFASATGWSWLTEQEYWWTSSISPTRVKAYLQYCKDTGPALFATMYGWSYDANFDHEGGNGPEGAYDPVYHTRWAGSTREGVDGNHAWGLDSGDSVLVGNRVDMDTYLENMVEYIAYCETNNIETAIIFSTLPVDDNGTQGWNINERGYQQYLKNEHIRDYIDTQDGLYFFDWADIMSYNDSDVEATTTWTDNNSTLQTFPLIHADNMTGDIVGHTGINGRTRIAKAMWWMLARIAGWDGN